MSVWVLVMIHLVPGVPRDVVEASPIYVGLFDSYAKWSKEDLQRNVAFMRSFSKELKDSGVFVVSEGLVVVLTIMRCSRMRGPSLLGIRTTQP